MSDEWQYCTSGTMELLCGPGEEQDVQQTLLQYTVLVPLYETQTRETNARPRCEKMPKDKLTGRAFRHVLLCMHRLFYKHAKPPTWRGRSELSGTRRRLEREGSPALVELEDHLARLKVSVDVDVNVLCACQCLCCSLCSFCVSTAPWSGVFIRPESKNDSRTVFISWPCSVPRLRVE